MALGVSALTAFGYAAPVQAVDLTVAYVTPAELTPALAAERQQPDVPLRPSFGASTPALTNDLLAAYVAKQQAAKAAFANFNVAPATERRTSCVTCR